jgi:hypothetical protein
MYRRKVSLAQINTILLAIGLPIVSTTIYLILYTPSVRVVTGTGSIHQEVLDPTKLLPLWGWDYLFLFSNYSRF